MEEIHFKDCGAILIGFIVSIVTIRIAYVFYSNGRPLALSKSVSTLIVLGSGGHTAEMLNIVNVLEKDKFVPRFYVAAGTDDMSLRKARDLEKSLIQKGEIDNNKDIEEVAYFEQIYRSREVGQSYLTSIYTTLVAILHALSLILKFRPEVIICNGPGTCIPICLVAFIFKVVGVRWASIFYIESIARVKRLSLSGLLLYKLHMTDQFYVQWPQLQRKYQRAHHVGCLM